MDDSGAGVLDDRYDGVNLPSRRVDVIDSSFHVHLRGTGPEDVVPVADIWLEPDLLAEISSTIPAHDFKDRPVACGLIGSTHSWRAVELPNSEYFSVLIEGNNAGHEISRYAVRHQLNEAESQLLRLIVGGYTITEAARRTGDSVARIRERRTALLQRLRADSFVVVVHEILGNGVLAEVAMAIN